MEVVVQHIHVAVEDAELGEFNAAAYGGIEWESCWLIRTGIRQWPYWAWHGCREEETPRREKSEPRARSPLESAAENERNRQWCLWATGATGAGVALARQLPGDAIRKILVSAYLCAEGQPSCPE